MPILRQATLELATFVLATLALAVLTAFARAQEMADLLPSGMRLGSDGKLVWEELQPATCKTCEGSKTVACWLCEGRPEPCGQCRDRRRPCRQCAGTGRQLDPCREMLCPGCSGTQRELCPTCDGTNLVVAPDGRGTACSGCKGARSFPCIDCGGDGCLQFGLLDGKDLRAASLERALARRQELDRLASRLEAPGERRSEPGNEVADRTALLVEIGGKLDLPAGRAERQAQLVAAAVGEEAEKDVRFTIDLRASQLARRIEAEQSVLDSAIWLHRRNAGEFDQPRTDKLAKSIHWRFPVGEDQQRRAIWVLLGRGFMRAPTAKDTEAVVTAWLGEHPEAVLHTVARLPDFGRGPVKSTLIQAWIVDGDQHLGLHLVERGCIPAALLVGLRPEIEMPFAEYLEVLRLARKLEEQAKAKKLGLWGEANPDAERLRRSAGELVIKGQYRQALAEYEAALAAGSDPADTLEQIGHCHRSLGDHEAALAALDKAIAAGAKYQAWRDKARCLWQLRGEAEAVAFVRGLAPSLDEHDVEQWLGELFGDMGRRDEAIAHYERSIDLATAKHSFRFAADGWLQVDEATLKKENNDFADLWPALEEVAVLHFAAGNEAKAMQFATMGVAIGQQLNRCKGYYDATKIAAGDVECRILRGRLFCRQGKLDEAEAEERLARALAQHSGYTGYFSRLQVLTRELAAARRAR